MTRTTEVSVIDAEELRSGRSFTFLGSEHGGIPVTAILDRSEPGQGPRLHRHPYDEVWILEQGEATFTAGDREVTAGPGTILVVSAGTAHRFVNTGTVPLRMTCIHPRGRPETEWL